MLLLAYSLGREGEEKDWSINCVDFKKAAMQVACELTFIYPSLLLIFWFCQQIMIGDPVANYNQNRGAIL